MPVGFDVTNQKASPALYASSFATRPAPAFVGRLFVDTDTPSTGIYRDTGTVWLSISGGSSETQSLNDVCVIGNTTTTLGILINGQSTVGTHDSSSSSIPPEADFALTIGEDYPATGFSIYTTHKNHFAGVLRNEGTVVFDTLGGTGSRIVVASADGTLTASAALSSYVTGSGTTNYLPKFTSASAIGNSSVYETGGNILINTTTNSGYKLDVVGTGRFSDTLTTVGITYTGAITMSGASAYFKSSATGFRFNDSTDTYNNMIIADLTGNTTIRGTVSATSATFSSSVKIGNFTTAQKNALTASSGMVVYDTTLNKLCVYTTAWETITSI